MEETLRAVLAPALNQFKRLVAAKRAWGATDEDISKTLSELETSMREMGIMSDAQINDSMQIYHEALREEAITHDARKQADAILGTLFDLLRDGMAEERKKGTSEAEIQQKIDDVCRTIEHEQRGRVPDRVVDEMKVMIREAAMPAGRALGELEPKRERGLPLVKRRRSTLMQFILDLDETFSPRCLLSATPQTSSATL